MATARKAASRKPAATAPAVTLRVPLAADELLRPPTKADKAAKVNKPGKSAKPQAKDRPAPKEAAAKPRKPKLVRDSFTIPKSEYAVLEDLKQRAAMLGQPAKKSEVLRAGVKALVAMADAAFLSSLGAVPPLKTGRPAKA
jgi:hypothetical protein